MDGIKAALGGNRLVELTFLQDETGSIGAVRKRDMPAHKLREVAA